jgi:hypothetical protein
MIQASCIQKRMEVFDYEGALIGTVESVDGKSVKLASGSDAREHFIPLVWIERVDGAVYLNERWAPVEEGIWSRTARKRQRSRLEGSAGATSPASHDS